MQLASHSLEQTILLGARVAPLLRADDMLVLCGDLGAGKTHFTKGVAQGLGVSDEVTSPTFNILRQHGGRAGYDDLSGAFGGVESVPTLAHWDLYRLESPEQLDDVDFFGVCESGVISLVEWGDKFPDELPENYVRIDVRVLDDDTRAFELEGVGSRGEELAQLIANIQI